MPYVNKSTDPDVINSVDPTPSKSGVPVSVHPIGVADVIDALKLGIADYMAKPSHYVFVVVIYPIIGLSLFIWASGNNALQLIYPLVTGFALLGPLAAVGLYEVSRRRELGLDASWIHAVRVWKSPAIPAILEISAFLLVLFLVWLYTAQLLYLWLYGSQDPASFTRFLADIVSTRKGWVLILMGNGIGFLFALVSLCTTVVTFPLLLDREVSAGAAIKTSVTAVLENPVPMLLWGFIVGVVLFLASLPFLVGLIVALPVLGHSTWHLYRKVVVHPDSAHMQDSATS